MAPSFATPVARIAGSLESQVRGGVERIRSALLELFAVVGADPTRPQEVSRSIGINRNLAWKLSKILGPDDPLSLIEHLPGASGVDIMLAAFQRHGATAGAVEHVRVAMAAFHALVEEHVGDRATLELVVGPMLPPHLQLERDRAARQLAFRGNSATWGIQADARLSTMFMAPNEDDPSFIDIATLGGLIGYRRLRSGTRWPLVRVFGFEGDGSAHAPHRREPIDPSIEPGAAPLMLAFCRGPQPPIIAREVPGGTQYEIGEGPIGNRGALTSVFGMVARRFASCYRDDRNETGEQLVQWYTPVRRAICDLVVHRGLPLSMPPELHVTGRMSPPVDAVLSAGREPIPMVEPIRSLGAGPPQLATPVIPDYREMTSAVFERLGWNPEDFIAFRADVPYPPIPSMAALRFGLAERSTA